MFLPKLFLALALLLLAGQQLSAEPADCETFTNSLIAGG